MSNPETNIGGYLNYCSPRDIIINMEEYWERVRRLREAHALSKEQLAQRAHLTASYIYRIEKGDVATPSYQTVKAIAFALGVTADELMGDKEPVAMTGDSWLLRLIQEVAPNLTLNEAKEFLKRVNRLGSQGRKAALAMLIGLSQSEDSNLGERAEG